MILGGIELSAGALADFEAVHAALGDPSSADLAGWCRRFLVEPPPDDWDGTVVMTTK